MSDRSSSRRASPRSALPAAARSTAVARTTAPFVHEALFYQDARDYRDSVADFLLEGLDLAEPTLMAAPVSKLDLVSGRLGAAADRVRFVNRSESGRNPGRIIAGVLSAFADAHPAGRVRIVGEPIWPGRSAAEYPSCVQHEALINLAFEGRPATILCPYDATRLGADVLSDARTTHPVLIAGGVREPSPDYGDPGPVADACHRAMPLPPEWWGDMLVFSSAADLRTVRDFVRRLAVRGGLAEDRADDLCVAVNEVATNTVVHTGRRGVVSLWQEPDSIVCEVADCGRITDRLVGRHIPTRDAPHGRGLLLAHLLCDLVQMPTGGVTAGTTVRLHMRTG